MAGHSRSKNGVASLAYVPAIHVFDVTRDLRRGCPAQEFTLGPAEGRTRVPGMTSQRL